MPSTWDLRAIRSVSGRRPCGQFGSQRLLKRAGRHAQRFEHLIPHVLGERFATDVLNQLLHDDEPAAGVRTNTSRYGLDRNWRCVAFAIEHFEEGRDSLGYFVTWKSSNADACRMTQNPPQRDAF